MNFGKSGEMKEFRRCLKRSSRFVSSWGGIKKNVDFSQGREITPTGAKDCVLCKVPNVSGNDTSKCVVSPYSGSIAIRVATLREEI